MFAVTKAEQEKIDYYLALVQIVIEAATEWGFQLPQLCNLLGMEPREFRSIDKLKEHLSASINRDVQERCEVVERIKSILEAIFTGDLDGQKEWLLASESKFRGRSPYDLMKGGGFWDLHAVQLLLQEVSD